MTGNVLFDFDGTLFDTYPGIARCVNLALAKMGKPPLPPETLRRFLGPPLYSSMSAYAGLDEDESEEAVRLFRAEYESAGVFESRPYEGLPQLLKKLNAAGVELGVASSKPIASIHILLEKHGMKDCFTRICGADKAERSADKRDLLLGAMTRRDAIMVGDRKFDVEAAKALGLRAVGVKYGFGEEEELVASGADFLAADAAELETILFALVRRD